LWLDYAACAAFWRERKSSICSDSLRLRATVVPLLRSASVSLSRASG
jgi:hypothetical protein